MSVIFGPNQPCVGFGESFNRYKIASVSDPTLAQQLRSRWTLFSGTGISIASNGIGSRNAFNINFGSSIFKTLSHQANWYTGFRFNTSGNPSNGAVYQITNNDVVLFVVQRNFDGTWTLFAGNSTVIDTSTYSIPQNHWDFIEISVQFSGSSNISVTASLRINGTVRASGSANSGINKSTLLSNSATGNVHWLLPGVSSAAGSSFMDLYIHNGGGTYLTGLLGDIRIASFYPNSDVVSDFSTSSGSVHFSLVNEHQPDFDTTYVEDGTVGHKDIYGYDDIPVFSGNILFVDYSACVRKTDEGTKSYKLNVGATGTEAESEEFFPSEDYIYEGGVLEADPNTGVPWTQAGFNAKDFGIEIAS